MEHMHTHMCMHAFHDVHRCPAHLMIWLLPHGVVGLCCAAGGTMANILISYSDPSKLKARLGAYVPPNKATPKALEVRGQYAQARLRWT